MTGLVICRVGWDRVGRPTLLIEAISVVSSNEAGGGTVSSALTAVSFYSSMMSFLYWLVLLHSMFYGQNQHNYIKISTSHMRTPVVNRHRFM